MLDNHHLYPDFMDLRPDNMRYMNDDPEQHRSVNMYGMSMVERYLYSLPEYRMEMHKSNFIEIFSYNGLLATRKVIGEGEVFLGRKIYIRFSKILHDFSREGSIFHYIRSRLRMRLKMYTSHFY